MNARLDKAIQDCVTYLDDEADREPMAASLRAELLEAYDEQKVADADLRIFLMGAMQAAEGNRKR